MFEVHSRMFACFHNLQNQSFKSTGVVIKKKYSKLSHSNTHTLQRLKEEEKNIKRLIVAIQVPKAEHIRPYFR